MSNPYDGLLGAPYLTVRIVSSNSNSPSDAFVGTGFFVVFSRENGLIAPLIITNKHVIEDCDVIAFDMPKADGENHRIIGSSHVVKLAISEIPIIRHPDDDVDLIAIAVAPIYGAMQRDGVEPFRMGIPVEKIPSREMVDRCLPIESVIMIGFPDGLMDIHNNLPVCRSGITATPLNVDYLGKREFAVDLAVFGGSSGSPVFLSRDTFEQDSSGAFKRLNNLYLVGILYAGYEKTEFGSIIQTPAPAISDRFSYTQKLNVGVCIKADRIAEFAPFLR